ncbi:MAG: thioredoxin domain-containing protein [Desulfuromonadaceae bacterium]
MKESLLHRIVATVVIFVAGFCSAGESYAANEWTLKREFNVEQSPSAMVAAPDGRMLYILVPGKILLYSLSELKVTDFMPVDKALDKLAYSGKDNFFILSSSHSSLVKVFQLENKARIDLAGSPIRGAENAPVTIAVYSDFQCPYCSQVEPVLAQLLVKFPKEVKIVFKNYPLSFHKFARSAATAALAAHEQGKYWEFHDRLFENSAGLSEDKILEIARSLKLDMDKFKSKRVDPGIQELINRDMAEAQDNGVTGTPSLFINGKPVKDRSFEGMQGAVRAELKGI